MEKSQKLDFIKLTTEGYPIQLRHPKNDFYESENYKGDGCAHDVKR